MATYFDGKASFKDVPVKDGQISTTEFLSACESVVKLFDLFEATAFSVVQSDMTGNIKKIRDRQLAAPAQSETLQDLVKNEMAADGKNTATEGLLWLTRGLSFTATGLRKSVANPTEELSTSFTSAYGVTLKQHHNFMVKPLFGLAMKACPARNSFYAKLGENSDAQLDEWLTSLELCVDILSKWIEGVKF
ncbi:glycolipid transfer protein domain-containing protein [Morchella snyderi]|nr:glycolipid transfer protein domain-containing protein [Morchella snyderi]